MGALSISACGRIAQVRCNITLMPLSGGLTSLFPNTPAESLENLTLRTCSGPDSSSDSVRLIAVGACLKDRASNFRYISGRFHLHFKAGAPPVGRRGATGSHSGSFQSTSSSSRCWMNSEAKKASTYLPSRKTPSHSSSEQLAHCRTSSHHNHGGGTDIKKGSRGMRGHCEHYWKGGSSPLYVVQASRKCLGFESHLTLTYSFAVQLAIE